MAKNKNNQAANANARANAFNAEFAEETAAANKKNAANNANQNAQK